MFYPQEMTQVQLIIPSKDLLAVTKELADQGVFHQADGRYPATQKTPNQANTWQDQAGAYAALERRILGLMQTLGIQESTVHSNNFHTMVEMTEVNPLIDQIDQEVKQSREQLADGQRRIEQLQNILHQIEPIAGLDVDLNKLRNPGYIYSILGVMPVANIDRLRTSLANIPFTLFTLRQDEQRAVVWLSGLKRNVDILERAARSAYLNPLSLPEAYTGTPAEIIRSIQEDIHAIEQQMSEQRKTLSRLAGERREQLQKLLWQVRASRILAEAIGRFGQFRYTYLIDGWVPSSKISDFERNIKKSSDGIIIDTAPYKRGGNKQNVPVALKNPKILSSFQGFVTNYARPLYNEVDPTFLLAIFFPFLFGAMFGDVGQGLLLTLLGLLLASRKVKALNALASLGGVVTGCGIAATIFGFLYGSVFGFEDILPALVFRPRDNILTTLALAIGIGVVLLSIGFLLNIFNAWTIKNWGHMLFEPHGIAGLLLYWSLIGLAIEVMLGKYIIPPVVFGLLALLTGLAVMFSEVLNELVEGHKPEVEGGVVIYAFRALFELFETLISLLSNSISFVRVGAFAVAHAGLTSVVFILAGLVSPSHGTGYYVVIALGNLFIIGFEGMIVGIQTMRLSYYEFFSKFFSGGGVNYEPLTLQTKPEK